MLLGLNPSLSAIDDSLADYVGFPCLFRRWLPLADSPASPVLSCPSLLDPVPVPILLTLARFELGAAASQLPVRPVDLLHNRCQLRFSCHPPSVSIPTTPSRRRRLVAIPPSHPPRASFPSSTSLAAIDSHLRSFILSLFPTKPTTLALSTHRSTQIPPTLPTLPGASPQTQPLASPLNCTQGQPYSALAFHHRRLSHNLCSHRIP